MRANAATALGTHLVREYPYSLPEFAAALGIPDGETIETVELDYPENHDRPMVRVITQVEAASTGIVEAARRSQAELGEL
jgi:hypothetical protein